MEEQEHEEQEEQDQQGAAGAARITGGIGATRNSRRSRSRNSSRSSRGEQQRAEQEEASCILSSCFAFPAQQGGSRRSSRTSRTSWRRRMTSLVSSHSGACVTTSTHGVTARSTAARSASANRICSEPAATQRTEPCQRGSAVEQQGKGSAAPQGKALS